MIVSSAPEKTLLKPRATRVPEAIPVWAASTPTTVLTWSATEVAVLRAISAAETVVMDAGASRAFSWRREAVMTIGLSTSACERIDISSSVVAPAATLTPSTRVVSCPMKLTTTEWVPGGTDSEKRPVSFVP